MKKFITGFFVGAVSLIPGISGGTVLFISNEFNDFTTKLTSKKQKSDYRYLFIIIIGIIIGAVSTSRVIEYLFTTIPNETLLIFIIFLSFSIIKILNNVKSEKKLSLPYLIVGLCVIFILSFLIKNNTYIYKNLPEINLIFLITFTIYGTIDGFITILPGISGSMVMMLLGPYYLYKSFLASLSFNNIYIAIPLIFYLIGDMLGIYLGSLFSRIMINKYESKFMSFILGLMIMSIIVLIPFNNLFNINYLMIIPVFIIALFIYKISKK